MTGPRTALLHPHHRRGRHLLPFIVAVLCGPLACSNDQTTGPTPSSPTGAGASASVWPRPKIGSTRLTTSGTPYRVFPSTSSSSGISAALIADGPSVLVLADTDVVSTTALATSLANGGAQVTVRPAPEYTWDGTNPSLSGFDVVVHLNGSTFDFPLPASAQTALSNFVANGGGFVGSKFNGYESQPAMDDLVLLGMGSNGSAMTCSPCEMTYQQAADGNGHPVLEGIPASFSFTADAHDAGPAVASASVLMEVPAGGPAVLVRQFGNGRVVNFSIAANYQFDDNVGGPHDPVTLQDSNIQLLYLNAVKWAAGSASGPAQSQSITFGALGGKVYGDPDFAISASASSALPVNFTTSGGCTVLGTTVSITAAGSCTITAHQAGNDDFTAAEDVSQSFQIQQAVPVIHWTPGPLSSGTPLGPSQLNATATGVGATPISGTFTYTPAAGTSFSAGTHSLSVQFVPASANYSAAQHSVSITVSGAMNFIGFYLPIRNRPYVNVAMAGSSVPVKFSLGTYRGLNVLQGGAPTSTSADPAECSGSALRNTVRPGWAVGSGLRSLGFSYTYVWKTSPSWAGSCRKLVVTLADGSTHEALFSFTAAPAATTSSTARRILGR